MALTWLRCLCSTPVCLLTRTVATSSSKKPHILTLKSSGKYAFYFVSFSSAVILGTSVHKRQLKALCDDNESGNLNEKDYESELAEADRLYSEHKLKELYEYLLPFKNTTNDELLWRVVRAYSDRSHMVDVSKEEKKQLIFDAMDVVTRALEVGPENGACHKWYGIMLCETGDYLGTKVKLKNAYVMKEHFELAVKLCPDDAISHHLNGMWCFTFADLSWYERKLASIVFGAPPTSTYEEALEHFEHGEGIEPGFFSSNQYMLGLVCKRLGRVDEARKWFELLLTFPVKKEVDKENVRKAEEQLRSF